MFFITKIQFCVKKKKKDMKNTVKKNAIVIYHKSKLLTNTLRGRGCPLASGLTKQDWCSY